MNSSFPGITVPVTTSDLDANALAVLQPGFVGTSAPDWLRRRLAEGLAGVGLFARNVEGPHQLFALTEQLRAERPDVLIAVDEEGGDVTRLQARHGSSFPGNLALGAVDDTELTRAVAHALGRLLASCGINVNWAPSADVNSNPNNPVIGVRSFGADPALVARHTAAYVEGLQSAGVAACTKHFPGHGDTAVDSHHAMPTIHADVDLIRRRELAPFRAALAAGSKAVMSAHILLPALDPQRPATLSPALLTGLLRAPEAQGGLGYDGLIVTDGIEMQAIAAAYGIERGTVLAIAAGADAVCVGGGLADEETVLRLRDALIAAVRRGELPEERLADAAARVRGLASWTRAARAMADTVAGRPAVTEPALLGLGRAGQRADPGSAMDGHPMDVAGRDGALAQASAVGLAAARRALRVTVGAQGHTPLRAPGHVVLLSPVANIAVGTQTPWGLATELDRMLPGTTSMTFGCDLVEALTPAAVVSRILTDARDRTIVVAQRDRHRHPWMAAIVAELVAARPELIVVEMGVPKAQPVGALYIATHGAARVCGQAAAEVIVGQDVER